MPSRWYERRDYVWLLTAEPPLCRDGESLDVLRRCERIRRGEPCLCRFDVAEMTDDLAAIGADDLAEKWLADRLDTDEVVAFQQAVATAHRDAEARASTVPPAARSDADQAVERVGVLLQRLILASQRGSGLSDEFSDDLEEDE